MSTPAQARVAAHQSWARTADRSARSRPGYTGLLEKFSAEARQLLGPGASDRQVAESAESLRKAHYAAISAAGVAARRRRAS